MDPMARIELAIENAVNSINTPGCAPSLAAAIRYAAIPGGARIRPKLCLAVAYACGEDAPELTDAAATAIELLHGASLVHDDLPCFDNADLRRGKPTVHRAYSEPLAVLTGDAMIFLAFELLARAGVQHPSRLAALVTIVAQSVGAPTGIVAGQAWECEQTLDLEQYHREKTGSLFVAATMAGAAAAGVTDWQAWRALGDRIGEAFQVADDIKDVLGAQEDIGKPVGQDAALARPNAVNKYGLEAAVDHLEELLTKAEQAIPDCPGAELLRKIVRKEASSFVPKKLLRVAA
jgi:geranylgeranyl diphosphate synthase, type II